MNENVGYVWMALAGSNLMGLLFFLFCSLYGGIGKEVKNVFRAIAFGFGGLLVLSLSPLLIAGLLSLDHESQDNAESIIISVVGGLILTVWYVYFGYNHFSAVKR